MASWPKTCAPQEAPRALVQLVEDLMPRLLAGEHPSLSVLRSQLESSRLECVVLTGAGFYVQFAVDAATPRVTPSGFFGGEAQIRLAGLERGLGCMIHVREGRIATLEGFTYEEDWPEEFRVLAVEEVKALEPPAISGHHQTGSPGDRDPCPPDNGVQMNSPFHLSFAVPDLESAKEFYCHTLGCELGRDKGSWFDVLFFGHQLTIHRESERHPALPIDHFGPILGRSAWRVILEDCRSHGIAFVMDPVVIGEGTESESGKFLIRDPAGNVLEFKYYLSFDDTVAGGEKAP